MGLSEISLTEGSLISVHNATGGPIGSAGADLRRADAELLGGVLTFLEPVHLKKCLKPFEGF